MYFEVKTFETTKIVIRYPDGYEVGKRYPTIILLHGAGGRGKDTEYLKENPFFKLTSEHENFPFISVAPLCNENTWFDLFPTLKRLAQHLFNADFVDNERLYLMGASMGGYASWQLAMSLPQLFAAIAPICGGGMYWNAARLVNVPAWAFHGIQDETVLPRESEIMVERINAAGGNAKLTIYEKVGHFAWVPTYSNPEVFEWLLSHKNENAKELTDIYKNAEIYG